MSNTIQAVSDASFEADVTQSSLPVLVDFWAPWCGPCKAIGPILEELATEYGDRLRIVKVNVDDNNRIPAEHNIRGIPTLLLFKEGKVVETKVGALNKSQLKTLLDSHL